VGFIRYLSGGGKGDGHKKLLHRAHEANFLGILQDELTRCSAPTN
jgi:hypothetical protein